MTLRCWPRKMYYVRTRWHHRAGGWHNYLATPNIARARMANNKLPVKHRQIDVRTRGAESYVLEGSWK